jgi:hypothetical protein
MPTLAERRAFNPLTPPGLPGTADVAAIDGPDEGGRGFLWDAAIAAGLKVRNYGVFCDDFRYFLDDKHPAFVPLARMPHEKKLRVAFPNKGALKDVTDPYFRAYDQRFPDYWRVKEWERELAEYAQKGELPALSLVRLPHDHFGSFRLAMDGVDTPDTQIADHDYAVGLLVEKLSRTPFWKDTVVIVIEDDAQNGADHVSAHRSFALFAGGHVKRGAVVSTVYTTTSVLRTIELLLGLPPLGQQDAFAPPMSDVFSETVNETPFTAIVPPVLRTTRLPVPSGTAERPRGDAVYWDLVTTGFDFTKVDAAPAALFNRVLFCGLVSSSGCKSDERLATDDDD